MPQITVIVPVYKVEPYLHRCVDSILAQTFTDFELILVDDGSPDNCGAICDEYAAKDSRVRVIHQANGGLSAARNAALSIATGKYAAFVDSDDEIVPHHLETAIHYMEQGFDLLSFGFTLSYDDERPDYVLTSEDKIYSLNSPQERAAFLVQILLQYKIGFEACRKVFRMDIIKSFCLMFEDNRKIFAEDLYFSICYCCHTTKIVNIQESLYRYYVRADSIMGVQKAILNAGRMTELCKAVLNYFVSQNMDTAFFNAFPAICYYAYNNIISRHQNTTGISTEKMRGLLLEDIQDFSFFAEQMRKVPCCKEIIRPICLPAELREIIYKAKYYADGKGHHLLLLRWNAPLIRCERYVRAAKQMGFRGTISRVLEKCKGVILCQK